MLNLLMSPRVPLGQSKLWYKQLNPDETALAQSLYADRAESRRRGDGITGFAVGNSNLDTDDFRMILCSGNPLSYGEALARYEPGLPNQCSKIDGYGLAYRTFLLVEQLIRGLADVQVRVVNRILDYELVLDPRECDKRRTPRVHRIDQSQRGVDVANKPDPQCRSSVLSKRQHRVNQVWQRVTR